MAALAQYWVCFGSIGTADPRRRSSSRPNAATICSVNGGSDLGARAASVRLVRIHTASTACRTALPVLHMRLPRWLRRRGERSSPALQRNASHLRIPAMMRNATTGRIFRSGAAAVWPCQWCHGAPGIGLARIATRRQGGIEPGLLGNGYPQGLERRGAKLAAPDRYAVLRYTREHRIRMRGGPRSRTA